MDISQLIGSLGFPIVACIALYIQNKEQREEHRQEAAKLTEALNNNTIALTKLVDKLGEDIEE